MPTILTICMPSDAVLCVIFTGLLRIPPQTAGQFAVIRMYGLQPSRPATSCIGQPGVDFPLRAAPAACAVAVTSKDQLRYRGRQHAETCLALGQFELLGVLRRPVAHDLYKAVPCTKPHHEAGSPKSGSILSLMPPLIFASTILRSSRALLLRGAAGAVLGRKNDVAVAAQNLLVGVPGETLRTDDPADHLPGQI